MAKMTIEGVTYEGTPEELRAIVATFETAAVTKAEPKIGDTVRLVSTGGNPTSSTAGFDIGDTGVLSEGCGGANTFGISGNSGVVGYVSAHHVEVIAAAPAKPTPAQNLTHKGADYTLVSRKAQPGDVVVFTDGKISAIYDNNVPHIVHEGGNLDTSGCHAVYREQYNRTEANVLVYAPVAETLKVGDYVEVIDGSLSEYRDLKTGTIGKITDIELGWSEPYRVDTDGDFDRFPASALRKVDKPAPDTLAFDKFPIGAKVRLLSGGGKYPLNGRKNGEIYTVTNNDRRHDGTRKIAIGGAYALPEQLELLSAEELVFAKLGRKMNEYKTGDIVRVTRRDGGHPVGTIGVLVSGAHFAIPQKFGVSVNGVIKSHTGAFELIAPVESRVDVA